MSHTKKYAILAVVLVTTVAFDQWTKLWAEDNLANGEHPLPVLVTPKEAGRTLGEVLTGRFSELAGDRLAARIAEDVVLLDRSVELAADSRIFAAPTVRTVGYYVFAQGALDLPPRRILRHEPVLLERWVRLAIPELPADAARDAVREKLSDVTLSSYIAERVPYVSDDEAPRIASELTFPVPMGSAELTQDRVVKEGELYLLTQRQVEVIPGFFQFIYAENPGAAWSFMAHADEGFRRLFFTLISLIAVVAIVVIVVRLEPQHGLAVAAFAAILGGAIGNFIDRLRLNYVIDFIDNYVGTSHWPTYNIADIGISVGVGLLLFEMLFKKDSTLFKEQKAEPAGSKA